MKPLKDIGWRVWIEEGRLGSRHGTMAHDPGYLLAMPGVVGALSPVCVLTDDERRELVRAVITALYLKLMKHDASLSESYMIEAATLVANEIIKEYEL